MEACIFPGNIQETPLDIDFGINNERQDCKIGTVYEWGI
jgi:hypothetical protein